jgi:hypothetical protein
MVACTVREFDIPQEVGGRGVEGPLGEDLIDAVKVCVTDIEAALSTQVGAVLIKVEGHILLEVVN